MVQIKTLFTWHVTHYKCASLKKKEIFPEDLRNCCLNTLLINIYSLQSNTSLYRFTYVTSHLFHLHNERMNFRNNYL